LKAFSPLIVRCHGAAPRFHNNLLRLQDLLALIKEQKRKQIENRRKHEHIQKILRILRMKDKVRPSLAFLWLAYSYMKDEELKRGACMDPHMSGYIDISDQT